MIKKLIVLLCILILIIGVILIVFLKKNKKEVTINDTDPNGDLITIIDENNADNMQFIDLDEKDDETSASLLSQREIEVLRLVASGMINKQIADTLNISINTVLTHRKNITAKLGIKSVSGLSFYAMMNGIIDPK